MKTTTHYKMRSLKSSLRELQSLIAKMPLNAVISVVVPEFHVVWQSVASAVRDTRMPMQSASVACVLCVHAAKYMEQDEIEDILGRLRLQLVATQSRMWHVVHLQDPLTYEPVGHMLSILAHRVQTALWNVKRRNMKPEVQSIIVDNLLYMSIRFVSASKQGSLVYVCTPPGEPVAMFSSLSNKMLVKACVEGLGFARCEDAMLHGQDIPSLLRISSQGYNAPADQLSHELEYNPTPTLTENGIDFTHRAYNEQYIEKIVGPDPPLLTNITVNSANRFFNPLFIDKIFNVKIDIKSDDVLKTLKSWVGKGVIKPTSDYLKIYSHIKSNKLCRDPESD